jgi:hypothetical protein
MLILYGSSSVPGLQQKRPPFAGRMRLVTLPNFSRGRRLTEVRGRGVVSTYLFSLFIAVFVLCL